MTSREEIKHELSEISPFLSKHEKMDPFEAPQGYFDEFPARISEKIVSQPRSWWRIRFAGFSVSEWAAVAGIATLILLAVYVFSPLREKKQDYAVGKTSSTLAYELPEETIINELDEESLARIYKEETALKGSQNPEIKTSIENYLIENVDDQLLKEEL